MLLLSYVIFFSLHLSLAFKVVCVYLRFSEIWLLYVNLSFSFLFFWCSFYFCYSIFLNLCFDVFRFITFWRILSIYCSNITSACLPVLPPSVFYFFNPITHSVDCLKFWPFWILCSVFVVLIFICFFFVAFFVACFSFQQYLLTYLCIYQFFPELC